ncbi:hypothetical protein DO97_07840 [Neosynechococcus sphagnicola sy1]|uniref:Glycosyl hydrolase-like 10 domain-containing protein n=1 Tax=Neosynechococcus sphagnicola sy1 TaxID=1497020 RepID=A0A098TJU8_9CYAN|nr:hypothetical protein DO97_07840 [Neosynechococcus sphagnicola sy1]
MIGLGVESALGLKPAQAQISSYCQQSAAAIAQKDLLRQAAATGDPSAEVQYRALVANHAEMLRRCRAQVWPQNTATWLRLYACDTKPGVLESVLDRIVDRGYNQVYIETFYHGRALLPAANNPTVWPSQINTPGLEQADLLATVIRKGHERGLKVYAWLFTMNFGYPYSQRPDRQAALARNGLSQDSLMATSDLTIDVGAGESDATFIDPYNSLAQQDYRQLVAAIAQRRPDGVLFDYIRYPKGAGGASVARRVQDLWIYGEASQMALLQRALNHKGQELIQQFLSKGYITAADLALVDKHYPQEAEPLWQGRVPNTKGTLPLEQRRIQLQFDLWQLSLAHAMQGIVDFLSLAALPAQRQGIPVGAVFFPGGNQSIGQGYDSRLQPWDRFPKGIEWHPMVYSTCGEDTRCLVDELNRVIQQASPGTQVQPALAGIWQQSIRDHLPLEIQMQAIRQVAPQINSVSHFAYSWQEPKSDSDRRSCRVP